MGRARKILEAAQANPRSLDFSDLVCLVEAAGWVLKRQQGSHRVYSRPGTPEIINIQPRGKDAKPYQVRQVVELIERYSIQLD